jgi:hypothetical protein
VSSTGARIFLMKSGRKTKIIYFRVFFYSLDDFKICSVAKLHFTFKNMNILQQINIMIHFADIKT